MSRPPLYDTRLTVHVALRATPEQVQALNSVACACSLTVPSVIRCAIDDLADELDLTPPFRLPR